MNIKSGSLFFLVSAILIIMTLFMFINSPNYIVPGKKLRVKQKKPHDEKHHYFDRDILGATQHRWHKNHKSEYNMNNIGQFRPRHPHHAL